MSLDENPVSVPPQALIAIVLSIVMVFVAVNLMDVWGLGWGPDQNVEFQTYLSGQSKIKIK